MFGLLDTLARASDSLLVSRITQEGAQAQLRVIGAPPEQDAVPVAPSLEDACLLLTAAVENGQPNLA